MLSLYLNPQCIWKDFLECGSTTKGPPLFQYLTGFVLLRRSSGLLESLSQLPATFIFFSKNNSSTVSWTMESHTHTLTIFLSVIHFKIYLLKSQSVFDWGGIRQDGLIWLHQVPFSHPRLMQLCRFLCYYRVHTLFWGWILDILENWTPDKKSFYNFIQQHTWNNIKNFCLSAAKTILGFSQINHLQILRG